MCHCRYDSHSGGEKEIQRTLLELLNQLDGFDSRRDVKVNTPSTPSHVLPDLHKLETHSWLLSHASGHGSFICSTNTCNICPVSQVNDTYQFKPDQRYSTKNIS